MAAPRFEELGASDLRPSLRMNGNNICANRWQPNIMQHVGAVHPEAVPITYDRIFRPKLVAHMYSIRGKAFLKRFYSTQHAAYNRGMRTLRGWVKGGFLGMSSEEFSKGNLRQNRDDADKILHFIKANIEQLEPLYFNDRLTIFWEVNEAYLKILEWRHYQRRNTSGIGRELAPKALLEARNLNTSMHAMKQGEGALHVQAQKAHEIDSYNMQDLRRHRCYPTCKVCTLCDEGGLGEHVIMFGSIHELPLQVVAWRYNMQRGQSVEYIETSLLDKDVVTFGISTLVKPFHNRHCEIWEVKVTKLFSDVRDFERILIPGGEGKAVHDLEIGSTIFIPSVYARRERCKFNVNLVDDPRVTNDRDPYKELGMSMMSSLGVGGQSFSQFMNDAINGPTPHEHEFNGKTSNDTREYQFASRMNASDIDLINLPPLELDQNFKNEHGLEADNNNEEFDNALITLMQPNDDNQSLIEVENKEDIDEMCMSNMVEPKKASTIPNNFIQSCNSMKESRKFASINLMMDVTKVMSPNKKKISSNSKKRKIFQELTSATNQTSHAIVSRSSRKVKKPSRYIDNLSDKENDRRVKKNSTMKIDTLATKIAHGEGQVTLVAMDEDEMESIAIEALGMHDVDEMYGGLLEVIRPLKREHPHYFGDCSIKSEKLHLLRCYVTWILDVTWILKCRGVVF